MNKSIFEILKSLTVKQLLIIAGVVIVLVAVMDTQHRRAKAERTAACMAENLSRSTFSTNKDCE